jgi:hypothetical protein
VDRCAIFIDAGHLLAEGGKLCCGTKQRAAIACDYGAAIGAIASLASTHCGLPILRTYWYDGARDAIPTLDHLAVAELANVKLRLGRLSGGKQKGVDALIYRDLMVLARERAVATAYLLAGDEDLREGVTAAQDMGVRVVVVGVETKKQNQAATLVREADEHIVLSQGQLAPFLSRATLPSAPSPAPADPETEAQKAGTLFAEEWVAHATSEDLQRLLGQAPVIPRELDAQLIRAGRKAVGTAPAPSDPADQRRARAMRRGFWSVVRRAGRG